MERLPGEHIVIACTAACAAIREAVPDHLKALVRRSYTQVQTVADFGDITADFVKITVYDEQGRCLDLRGQLDEFDDEAYIVASDKQWIDIANAGVHKGTTVARLQQLVGAGRHETLVFGDGLNDIELMECADFSFAMRNGHDGPRTPPISSPARTMKTPSCTPSCNCSHCSGRGRETGRAMIARPLQGNTMDKYSPEERRLLILDLLAAHHKVMAAELAEPLGTTEATIRRDLRYLADEGRCKRIHGGAISLSPQTGTLTERSTQHVAQKQALAMAALSLVKPNQLIFLDASSTHLLLASLMPEHQGLTVVTNSPVIACRLLERPGIRTILLGGEQDPLVGGAVDITAAEGIKKFRFDLGFLGVCAWSSDLGFSAVHYQDSEFKRQVAERSGSLAVLCNDDKLESLASYPFLHAADLDYLICTRQDPALLKAFEGEGCTVITAG